MEHLLVFDLDDTLYPERAFVRSGFRAAGAWLVGELGVDGFTAEATRLFEGGLRGTVFDAALDRLGVAATPELIATLVQVYREHSPDIALHDDAAWALEHFGHRFDLALLSDGFLATQQKKVQALGIAPRFLSIVYSDELGRENWKPSPVPYRAVMERTGYTAGACTYVSDNPVKDFITANVLGWATIRVRRVDGVYRDVEVPAGHDADLTIDSLWDLPSVIGARPGTRGTVSDDSDVAVER